MKTSNDVINMDKLPQVDDHQMLINLWEKSIDSVKGRKSVCDYFRQHPIAVEDLISSGSIVIAIGKAASDMMLGAIEVLGDSIHSGLVLTKYDHTDVALNVHDNIRCYESAHPVPDQASLDAGRILVETLLSVPDEQPLLMLISGGASSLVDVTVDGVDLVALRRLNEWGLNNGFDINEINYMRQKVSQIKGGGLCDYLTNQKVLSLYISDVPEDNLEVVGSGLLYQEGKIERLISSESKSTIDAFLAESGIKPKGEKSADERNVQHAIIADNAKAKSTLSDLASRQGYSVHLSNQSIDRDYQDVADLIFEQVMNGEPGVYIWGGEPTVILPENPGLGGRNQALALLLAKKFNACKGITALVAGTDGTDGPTDAAGALIDGETYGAIIAKNMSVDESLKNADAYHCLEESKSLFIPGPTGTNVMDLIIVCKRG